MTIKSNGSMTAGRELTLTCSVKGLKLQNINNFTWKRSNGSTLADSDLRQIQSSNLFDRSLIFDPLFTSHGGNYTCKISAGGRNTSVVIQCMILNYYNQIQGHMKLNSCSKGTPVELVVGINDSPTLIL